MGPGYVKPTTNLAPFHNLAAASVTKPAFSAPSLDNWWTGFDDPMLVTVVQRALDQNLDLAAAFARVRQARAAAAAGAQLLPTADLAATVTAEHQSFVSPFGSAGTAFPGYRRDQREYTVGPVASWEIDLSGGQRRGAAAAADELQVAQAEHVGTRITVAAEAAGSYLQVREFQARLAVAQELIDTDTRLLDLVEVRRRVGVADDRESAEAEALLKLAQSTVPSLRVALEAQLNRLDVLMGVQPGTYARGTIQAWDDSRNSGDSWCRTASRCPAAPPRYYRGRAAACRVKRANWRCDFGLLSEDFTFWRSWFRQYQWGHSL